MRYTKEELETLLENAKNDGHTRLVEYYTRQLAFLENENK